MPKILSNREKARIEREARISRPRKAKEEAKQEIMQELDMEHFTGEERYFLFTVGIAILALGILIGALIF